MAAADTLAQLEASRSFIYRMTIHEDAAYAGPAGVAHFVEEEMEKMHRLALERTSDGVPPSERLAVWEKMVSICDFFASQTQGLTAIEPAVRNGTTGGRSRQLCEEKREACSP